MFFLNSIDRKIILFLGIVLLIFNVVRFVTTDKIISSPSINTPVIPVVNVNKATVLTLQKLPGIGPVTAAKIIDHRNKRGYFSKAEDLLNVKGIGEKTLDKMREYIIL